MVGRDSRPVRFRRSMRLARRVCRVVLARRLLRGDSLRGRLRLRLAIDRSWALGILRIRVNVLTDLGWALRFEGLGLGLFALPA